MRPVPAIISPMTPDKGLASFLFYVFLYAAALVCAHLLAKVLERWLHLPSWLKSLWTRIRRWLILPSEGDQFPFEVLDSTEGLRRWLSTTQRLTLISVINSRIGSLVGINLAQKRQHALIRAPADIGKTREALWLIESWTRQHRIESRAAVLVPRNPFSIPSPPNLPVSSLRRLIGTDVVLLLDDLPLLCSLPGSSDERAEALRRLIDYFEALDFSSFLVVLTGRTHQLAAAFGSGYHERPPFASFTTVDLPDFSNVELDRLIHNVAVEKGLNVTRVAGLIARAAGSGSAENIVQFLDSCQLHSIFARRISWLRRAFGEPLRARSVTTVSEGLIALLTRESEETWRNLVFVPAGRNYPEVAVIYESVASLVAIGVRPYIELVFDLSRRRLRFGLLRGFRVERALRSMRRYDLHLQLDDYGTLHCPDVVTSGVHASNSQAWKGVVRSLQRFAEPKDVLPAGTVSQVWLAVASGATLLLVAHLLSGLLIAWIFPGELVKGGLVEPVVIWLAAAPALLLVGQRLRSGEPRLLTYFFGSVLLAQSAAKLMLEDQVGHWTITATWVFYTSLFSAMLLLIMTTSLYRRLEVRALLRGNSDPATLARWLQQLSFFSPGRDRIWVGPLQLASERALMWPVLMFVSCLATVFIGARFGMQEPWYTLATFVFGGYALLRAVLARPYRLASYAVGVTVCFGSVVVSAPIHSTATIVQIVAFSAALWVCYLWVGGLAVASVRRTPATDASPALLAREPLYPSGPRKDRAVLSARALIAVAWLVAGLSIVSFAAFTTIGFGGALTAEAKSRRQFATAVWLVLSKIVGGPAALEYRIGREYSAVADYSQASIHFRRAASVDPSAPENWRLLAVAAYESGRDELALDALDRLTGMMGDTVSLRVLRAKLLFAQGQYSSSLSMIVQGRANAESDEAWPVIVANLIELRECGRFDELAQPRKPTRAAVELARARCERVQGRLDEATSIYRAVAGSQSRDAGSVTAAREAFRVLAVAKGHVPRTGVIVTGLSPFGEGASRGLRVGDVILSVDGQPIRMVSDPNRWRSRLGDRQTLLWEVWRRGEIVSVRTRPLALGAQIVVF